MKPVEGVLFNLNLILLRTINEQIEWDIKCTNIHPPHDDVLLKVILNVSQKELEQRNPYMNIQRKAQ